MRRITLLFYDNESHCYRENRCSRPRSNRKQRGTHLRAVGGRGRRGRGSDLPALMTGSLAAASRSHTGWDLHQRETRDTRQVSRPITFREIPTPPMPIHPPTFQRRVPEALGARWPSGEHVGPHVGRRDGRGPIPRRQLGLGLREEREADGRNKT